MSKARGLARPSGTTTMRAVVQDSYGGADVLRLDEVLVPTAGKREVLVQVAAAAIDRGTWHLMAGRPYLVRLGSGLRGPRQRIPGRDVAGTIVAVGAEVTDWAVGDEVIGIGRGSLAEFCLVREDRLALRPAVLPPEQAATLGVSGGTALQAIDCANVTTGQRVLITGRIGGRRQLRGADCSGARR